MEKYILTIFVFLGGESKSLYKLDRKVCASKPTEESVRYTSSLLKSGYRPDSAWTLDVCETKSGEFKLLEVNGFSCAGLYGCDLDIIAKEVSKQAIKDWEESYE